MAQIVRAGKLLPYEHLLPKCFRGEMNGSTKAEQRA
jgi:hypothetical protein